MDSFEIARMLKNAIISANIEIHDDYLIVDSSNKLKAIDVTTSNYPAFPTDLQQPFVTLLTQAQGESTMTETIYENRFMNIPYLNQMGANINVKDNSAIIIGKTNLKGKEDTP